MKNLSIVVLSIICLAPATADAQFHGPKAPDTLSFQAYVTDPGGIPITDTLDIKTTLYKGGIAGFAQTHTDVGIIDGYFGVLIGPVDTVQFNQPIEVGIQIGGDPEISPRTPLVSVPFALGIRGMHGLEAQSTSYTGLNMIGGWSENYVAAGIAGVTISGGGGIRGSTTEPDSVTGDFGTVGGGLGNRAGSRAVVGGGRLNRALGTHATVGGGLQNTAIDGFATVAGGEYNWVRGIGGTVGGGYSNEVDSYGTISGGSNNDAQGDHGTVPGGGWNDASGIRSFAAGWAARAAHFGSFVWADGVNTNPPTRWSSTGDNQFLIKATGGVGIMTNQPDGLLDLNDAIEFQADNIGSGNQNARIFLNEAGQAENHGFSLAYIGNNSGTATFDSTVFNLAANRFYILSHSSSKTGTVRMSINRDSGRTGIGRDDPEEMLHLQESGGSTGIKLGGGGTSGPNGIVFEDDADDAGVQLFWRTTDNQFVLEKSSAGTGVNGSDIFLYDRDDDAFGFETQVYPITTNTHSLGRSGNLWSSVWAANGTIQMSDRRLKQNIVGMKYGLDQVMQLEPVSYSWKSNPEGGAKLGLVAQDVQAVIPEVVKGGDTPDEMLGMNYAELVPVLIKAIQEQQEIIESQNRRLAALEARVVD